MNPPADNPGTGPIFAQRKWDCPLPKPGYRAGLVILGMLLALPSLWSGLMFDDFIIRATAQGRRTIEAVDANPWEPFTFLTDNARQRRAILDRGLCPWWTDPRCRVAFMRPLAALTHMLDYRVWPGRLMLMHAQSLAWFALLIWAVLGSMPFGKMYFAIHSSVFI